MKKGHRRTHSETICISRPTFQQIEKPARQQQKQPQSYFQLERIKQPQFPSSSIQSLLQKSQSNITQRVLYIQNLQQPDIVSNNTQNFSFGKGVNFKLSNFKLNMGEIIQVPKSNQSTSLQGQSKIENLEKELYFAHLPIQNQLLKPIKTQKQSSRLSVIHQRRTKTASTFILKQISKIDKIEKNQPKIQLKNTFANKAKEDPVKKPKLEYQTHKKNVHSFGGTLGISTIKKIHKQYAFDQLAQNEPKRKRKNLVI